MPMTPCLVCASLNMGHKKSTGTEPMRKRNIPSVFHYTVKHSRGTGVYTGTKLVW